jgi:rhodanese-related sulfurtransferase
MAKTVAELVAEAKQRVENLSVDQVAAELDGGDAIVIDVREQVERDREGAIPGAVHAPRGMLEFFADPTSPYHRPEFDPDRRIILHCAAGGRSAMGAEVLQRMGYGRVAHLDGGFTAWKAAGQPTEGGEQT